MKQSINREQNSRGFVRVRIAPSPTGYPHIGTVYQALFNYAFAKKHSGKFIVRIEDTDRTRFVTGAEDVIFSSLDWFGLIEDESPRKDGGFGPYRQSERLALYHKYAEELISKGHAYFSYFPKKESGVKKDYSEGKKETEVTNPEENPPVTISEMMEKGDWVVRMRVPKKGVVAFRDEIRGEISFPVGEITEQVLIKSDGFPTYHLGVVVDDHLMEITDIVRGEEWISSTPKHILLYQYFGWDIPKFYHTPDLRNPDKSKLSKRQGHTNVNWYKDEGYLPEAILNFLALQGWSHPDEKEIFPLSEFISLFQLKDIKPVGPIFDLTKLTWMNQQYIQNLSVDQLKEKLLHFYKDNTNMQKLLMSPNRDKILELVRTRMTTLKEFEGLVHTFFESPDKSSFIDEHYAVAPKIKSLLEKIPDNEWNKDRIFQAMKSLMTETRSIRMPVFYVLFTGRPKGLPLPEVLELLKKEETLKRLEAVQ